MKDINLNDFMFYKKEYEFLAKRNKELEAFIRSYAVGNLCEADYLTQARKIIQNN